MQLEVEQHISSMLRKYCPTLRSVIILVTISNLLPCGWGYGKDGCRGSTARRQDPSSCHQYFQCIAGVSYRARCEPGTVFRRTSQKCENSARIPCTANKVTGHPLVREPCRINGEIRPSEIECDKYLLCRVNYYVGVPCPFGLIFSNVKYRCVTPPDQCATAAEAGGAGTLPDLELKKEENPYIGICDGKINQTVPEPFDCSMYILCEEDRSDEAQVQAAMSILECPNKTLFSASQNKCLPPSAVYCGTRYRVVNFFGPDIPPPPAAMGRSIGGNGRTVATGRNPEKPKYWIQPGKYRAIAAKPQETPKTAQNKTNHSTTSTSRANSSKRSGGGGIITSSINGFIVQKPLKVEQPTPIETTTESDSEGESRGAGTTEEDDDDDEEETTTNSGIEMGRSLRKSDTAAAEKHHHGRSAEKGGKDGKAKKAGIGHQPPTTEIAAANTATGVHDATNSRHLHVVRRGFMHHDPVVVNIIMGNGQKMPTVTRLHPSREHRHHKSSKENQLDSQASMKGKERFEEGMTKRNDTDEDDEVSAEHGSLESDEDEPFRFNKSGPRAPKRTSVLDDYHAVLNGKRFNSTAEDILYYGEDVYYVGDSNETGIVLPRNPNREVDSLELTHHTSSGSPASPKAKLPERAAPLDK